MQVQVKPVAEDRVMALIDESGVEQSTAIALKESFAPFTKIIAGHAEEALAIVITSEDQKVEMKQAGVLLKKFRDARIACEKARKAMKADSLNRGRAIDNVAKFIAEQLEPIEEHLEAQAKFAERQEAERKAKLENERKALIAPYGVDTAFYDFANMPQQMFDDLLASTKLGYEAKKKAEADAEAKRIADEKARIEEEARIRAENARLKAEAEAAAKIAAEERIKAEAERAAAAVKAMAEMKAIEAKAAEERHKLEVAAAKERAEKERLEQAEQERVRAELFKQRAEEAAKKKAAKAPDADKIKAYAKAIDRVPLPECSTPEAKELVRKIGLELLKYTERIVAAADKL